MNAISEKQKILGLVQQTYDDLMTLAMSLSAEEKKSKGSLKLWSAKDMFAHLIFWENHFKDQLKKLAAGKKIPNAGDYYDQVNDGVLYEHMDQPFEDALKEYRELHSELVSMYAQFSEEDLADLKKYDWLEGRSMADRILGNSVWHPESHLADYLVKRGKLEQATRMQEALTEKLKSFSTWSATAMYNLACFYALNGMHEKAIPCLKEAFKGQPDLIEWSKQDTDLDSLRNKPELKVLY